MKHPRMSFHSRSRRSLHIAVASLTVFTPWQVGWAQSQEQGSTQNAPSNPATAAARSDASSDFLHDRGLVARITQGAMRRFVFLDAARPLPDFQLMDSNGGTHRLSDWRGDIVLLNVWASWCAPCREEMPALARLMHRAAESGIRVVTLSIDKTGKDAHEFLQAVNAGELPLLLDPEHVAIKQLNVEGAPTSLLIDGRGRELGRATGTIDWNADEALLLLKAVALKVGG